MEAKRWHQSSATDMHQQDTKGQFSVTLFVDHNPSFDDSYNYNIRVQRQTCTSWIQIYHILLLTFWALFPHVLIIIQDLMTVTMMTSGISDRHAPACRCGWGSQHKWGARRVWARWRQRSVLHACRFASNSHKGCFFCFLYGPKTVYYKQIGPLIRHWSQSPAKETNRQAMPVKRIYNSVYQSPI